MDGESEQVKSKGIRCIQPNSMEWQSPVALWDPEISLLKDAAEDSFICVILLAAAKAHLQCI